MLLDRKLKAPTTFSVTVTLQSRSGSASATQDIVVFS